MNDKIYTAMWIDLPREYRNKLTEVFSIERTGISEVRDDTLISDGYTNTDLQAITREKMAEYVGSSAEDTAFHRLWELTLAKIKFELNPPTIEIGKGELSEQKEEKDVKKTKSKS